MVASKQSQHHCYGGFTAALRNTQRGAERRQTDNSLFSLISTSWIFTIQHSTKTFEIDYNCFSSCWADVNQEFTPVVFLIQSFPSDHCRWSMGPGFEKMTFFFFSRKERKIILRRETWLMNMEEVIKRDISRGRNRSVWPWKSTSVSSVCVQPITDQKTKIKAHKRTEFVKQNHQLKITTTH